MQTKGYSIGSQGCVLTSFAMYADWDGSNDDPGDVNTTMGNDACLFAWDEAGTNYDLGSPTISWSSLTDAQAIVALIGIMDACTPAIVGMEYGSNGTHFVFARGYVASSSGAIIYIHDPASTNNTTLGQYFNSNYSVNKIVYY